MVRAWEERFKVSGWKSSCASVNRLLLHLKRIGGSQASRDLYCSILYAFCKFVGKEETDFIGPDDLLRLSKEDLTNRVQDFCDLKVESPRYANTMMQVLKTFFRINGFKGDKELSVESYSLRMCGRKKPEYVPTLAEALKMANVAGSLKNRSIVLVLLSTGLRNSTLRAILYGEVKKELDNGLSNIHIRVHRGMKKIVPNACKGGIEYSVFTSPEATEALQLYIKERVRRFGKIDEGEPVFISEPSRLHWKRRIFKPLTSREVQLIVKEAAKRAAIEKWADVTPHTLRKTFATWVLCAPLIDGSRLDIKTQEVFMGHKLLGSMDAYYDRSKIEHLRGEYSKLVFNQSDRELTKALRALEAVSKFLGVDKTGYALSGTKGSWAINSDELLRVLRITIKEIEQSRETHCRSEMNATPLYEQKNQNHATHNRKPEQGLPFSTIKESARALEDNQSEVSTKVKDPLLTRQKKTKQIELNSFLNS
ncbi:MAG: site-specific integrase [Candidatus Bathyarchaeota archaeon]|nr:site-specific integrase [Candidatus Bathyarchaeota archaeon]MDH5595218.1 site-specific integrase [Candidatus Bathyarchaeota archaeon]